MPPERSPEPAPTGLAGIWQRIVRAPATGGSFLLVILVASVVAITVTIWAMWSASHAGKRPGTPATFRI
jgi:hypothetical protein